MSKNEKELVCNKHGITIYSLSDGVRSRWKCKKCIYDTSTKYIYNLKKKAIEYKGGKCIKCSYKKCTRALSFHHLDPSQKDFNIGTSRSWEKIKKELDKCILVCLNCHNELHHKEDKHKIAEQKYFVNRKELSRINKMLLLGTIDIVRAYELLEEKEGKINKKVNLRLELFE